MTSLLCLIPGLLIVCASLLFVEPVAAKNCSLMLEVVERAASGKEGVVKLDQVEAVLIKLRNGKKSKAKIVQEKLYFSSLEESDKVTKAFIDHRVFIKKSGYQQTLKSINVDCSQADKNGVFNDKIVLRKGDPTEKIHIIDN